MEEVKEPAVAYSKNKYTIAEYLEMEEAATEKHEYYQGEIFAMSGTKVSLNIIAGNTFGSLMYKLKGKSCRPFNSDQRIHIEKNTLFTYPEMWLWSHRRWKHGFKPEYVKNWVGENLPGGY